MDCVVIPRFDSVCDAIKAQCATRTPTNRFAFTNLLKHLTPPERYLAARYFTLIEWNCGSLGVLQIYQELRLLSATEFVISFKHRDKLYLVLNDFLEAEFELITSLFISMCYDNKNEVSLGIIIDEALTSLFKDLLTNPTINNLDYLETVRQTVPADVLTKTIEKHLSVILDLHCSNIRESFRNFSIWINEGVDDIIFTKLLYDKLLSGHETETLNHLFKLSTMEHFKEWKFYLILLQTIASRGNNETISTIKKYFKNRLNQIASVPNKNAMLHLLLSMRAATATTLDIEKNLNAYADWYKQNIGEMKFVMDTEKFQNVLKTLEECIDYELEVSYMDIHATISISPPVMCGKLVQCYKARCKARLSLLKGKQGVQLNPNGSITIEDSE